MLRIVDGNGRSYNQAGFDSQSAVPMVGTLTDQFAMKAHDLGHGHLELAASRVVKWVEADWSPSYLQDVLEAIQNAKAEADPEEEARKHRKRAARRARTRVRRLCKAMGADTLLTLTYRDNVMDIAVMKADLKEFVRRVTRVLPTFRAVVGFEQQDRGAWHAHIATAGIPQVIASKSGDWRSYNVLRAIWRSVTKDRGGNVDVQRRKRHSRKSAAQIAAYLSKYISKSFEELGGDGVNLWTKFGAVEVPPPVDLGKAASLLEALSTLYQLVDKNMESVPRLDRWRDWFFLVAEARLRGTELTRSPTSWGCASD